MGEGCLSRKPVATPKSVNWLWLYFVLVWFLKSDVGNGFFRFFVLFWHIILGLESPQKNNKNNKKKQTNDKKTPVAAPKLVNWLVLLALFDFFWVSTLKSDCLPVEFRTGAAGS